MFLRNLCLAALLVTFATATIDCSVEDTCFGEPYDCDPDTECTSLFHFDTYGNLHLFLRNFSDPQGYAAFAVARHPDETIEYFICRPRQKQLLRAIAELGELVLVTEDRLSGEVDSLDHNYYRCLFNAIELPIRFEREQFFFVSKGTYDEVLIILDGVQLYNLDRYSDSEEDLDDEESHPVIHHIGAPVQHRVKEDVLTSRDKAILSDTISNLPKVTKTQDDVELEKLARSPRQIHSRISNHHDEDDSERELSKKAYRSEEDDLMEEEHRPHNHKSKRPTDIQDDDEEISEEEEYEVPKRKNTKRSRHHIEYDLEDDKPHRKTFKKSKKDVDEDDYENDDILYDDVDVKNADNRYILSFTEVVVIGLIYEILYGQ